jgi:hypothetical protein
MPYGYTFSDFIKSDISEGKFTGDFYTQEEYVYYNGFRLVDATLSTVSSGTFYYAGEAPTQILRVENFNNTEEFTEYTMPLGTLWSEFVTAQTDSGNTSFTIVDGFVMYNGLTLWSDVSGGVSVTANSVASGTVYYLGGDIHFTIDGTTYQAEQGMSWADWVESDYNINQRYSFRGAFPYFVSLDGGSYYVYNPNTESYAAKPEIGIGVSVEYNIIPDVSYITKFDNHGGGSHD